MKQNPTLSLLAGALALGFATHASAQVLITNASTTYTQNFDTLTVPNTAPGGTSETNGTDGNWTDNATANVTGLTINAVPSSTRFGILGWHAYATADRDVDFPSVSGAGTVNRIWGNFGSSSSSRFYSYSVLGANPVSDKAMGAVSGGSAGNYIFGLRLTNNTGADITDVTVSYRGEQWRQGNTAGARTIAFSYQMGSPANLNSGTWSNVTGLNFSAPNTAAVGPSGTQLDGNATANSSTVAATALGLGSSWANGTDIWLRWFVSGAGNHGVAIDDVSVSFTAIPEPSAFATLAGLGALALVASRRRSSR